MVSEYTYTNSAKSNPCQQFSPERRQRHGRPKVAEFCANSAIVNEHRTEDHIPLCERCAGHGAVGFLCQRKLPPVRRVHADDAAMSMVVSSNVG